MAHVAFIGLGRMGHGMAGRYLDAGFTLAVWNRSQSKANDLIARGARWALSAADAADGADAVVTMVADDEASRAVWLGKDGAAATAKAGTLAIQNSTRAPRHSGAARSGAGPAPRGALRRGAADVYPPCFPCPRPPPRGGRPAQMPIGHCGTFDRQRT